MTKSAPATSPSRLETEAADRTARSQRSAAQRQERLAAGLAMVAGFVDAYGIITYGVYVSFMSGNTTQTGYQAGQGAFSAAAPSALAILFFVGGSFAGTLLAEFAGRRARRLVFGVAAAALAAIIGFTQLGSVSAGVAHRDREFRDGGPEHRALPRRRAIREPDFRHGNLEPDWGAFRAGAQARVPPGRAGTVGHPSAPSVKLGGRLDRVPCRRVVVGGGDAAVWRLGSVVSRADPVGIGGVRSDCWRRRLTERQTTNTRGEGHEGFVRNQIINPLFRVTADFSIGLPRMNTENAHDRDNPRAARNGGSRPAARQSRHCDRGRARDRAREASPFPAKAPTSWALTLQDPSFDA